MTKTVAWFYRIGAAALLAGCAHHPAPVPGTLGSGNPTSAGLDRHDFLYCGEWQTDRPGEHMYLVRGGKVVWETSIGDKEELGDCTMLSNGHIVFVRKGAGASEIVPDLKSGKDGEILWTYAADPQSEVHSVQPIGQDKVLIVQNGTPPKMFFFDTKKKAVVGEVINPPAGEKVHGQFRHVRLTADGTFMVAHLNLGKVVEYAADGKTVLWEYDDAPSAWAAVKLKNGNVLISGNQKQYLREVTRDKRVIWELTPKDVPFPIFTLQGAERLANGNTIVNSWVSTHDLPKDQWKNTVQTFEVTPDKQVVWKVQAWGEPNLGPASCTQMLDEKGVPETPGDLAR